MTTVPRGSAVATALALTALCAALIVRASTPPAVVPASAPPQVFSAERAMRHVRAIAERPHPSGSADHARVRAYVVAELTALGLTPQVQEVTGIGTRYQVAGRVANVLARLPGKRAGGPAVLIAAHYDGVGAGPAAGDDGSGSAALLETLRALKAGSPPEHDVIALFTDAEESGLLGAAAFVREHPWAHEVAVMLNVEARGTGGRSLMFETGTGNLDVARVLRTVPDVTASSLTVTVYRTLPNDTDLSELMLLGTPALNFAFIEGVARYHTSHDDVAHLDPRSVQHHGSQMLALVRAFAGGPLPRAVTGDAIFFDVPFIGLVVYPEGWSLPIAAVVIVLVVVAVVRVARSERQWGRDMALGAATTLIAAAMGGVVTNAAASALMGMHAAQAWDGAPMWRGVYSAALALLALGAAGECWAAARRWAGAAGFHAGALVVWSVIVLLVSWKVPGGSFLFAWPLAAVAVAALVASGAAHSTRTVVATWIATIVAASFVVPVLYLTSGISLPLVGPGAIAIGVLVPLLALLLAPLLETMGGDRRALVARVALGASAVVFAVGLVTVRRSVDYPTVANLTYAMDADSGGAWLVASGAPARRGSWVAAALGPSARTLTAGAPRDSNPAPPWLVRALDGRGRFAARPASRIANQGPQADVLSDSLTGAGRRLVLRVHGAPGTLSFAVRVLDAAVLRAEVDGREVATTRYRRQLPQWTLVYIAPADSGFALALTVPAGAKPSLELSSRASGLPTAADRPIPPRPDNVVPGQNGDVTVVYRRVQLP